MKIDAHPISGERVKAQAKPAATKRERAEQPETTRTDTVELSVKPSDAPIASIDDALALVESLGPLPSDAENVHTATGAEHTWDLIRV